MTSSTSSPIGVISRSEEEDIFRYIEERVGPIHIFGEPGIGKTTILNRIEENYADEVDIDRLNMRPNHDIPVLFGELCHSLFEHLPEEKKEKGWKFSGGTVTTPIGGIGVSTATVESEASRAQFGYRDALKNLCEAFPNNQPLFVCVDDVHELSNNEREVRGAIQDASAILPSNIVLITAGRLAWDDLETSVYLSMFGEDQAVEFLQDVFPTLCDKRARGIHEELGGHPLYIGLLAESNTGEEVPNIPEEEVQTEIKTRYFDFLDLDERRILLATAPLRELNEELGTNVLPESYGFDRVIVSDILDSLSTRTIVQATGRNTDGIQTFKVHDVFREFLVNRSEHNQMARNEACIYYSKRLIQLADEDRTLETEVNYVTSWSRYLSNSIIDKQSSLISRLVEQTISDEGLGFYPSSLIISEFKTSSPSELPDPVIESLLSSVNESCYMGNDFYDEELNQSWTDLLFEQGEFTNPGSNLVGYLGRVAESRPTFVRRVAEEIETDDKRTLRFLISIGQELPEEDATVIGEEAATWIREGEAYAALAFQGLQLSTHLAENDRYDVVLEILQAVLEPRNLKKGDQLDLDQGMVRYSLTKTIDRIFDDLVSRRAEPFVQMLATNLQLALQDGDEKDGNRYKTIVEHQSVANLGYVESNRGGLKEILLDYFVRAVNAWIDEGSSKKSRKTFIDNLLSENAVLRRVGLYILSEHPETYQELIEAELIDKENYRDQQPDYEFYRVLNSGFEYLDKLPQNRVCEIIQGGPYVDTIEDRATMLAERSDESIRYFERRIQETWRRDRFYLVRDQLEEEYAGQLDKLVEKYGEPDRLPFQSFQSEVRSGVVRQLGPQGTEDLLEQSAEEVLSTAVEWEPSNSEWWETDDDGQFEEENYTGFSRQLRELIKESPQRYAREISVIEDANPRYAEAAFRAFEDLVDDGEVFPWESIINLGQSIVSSSTDWSDHSKTNLATLINRGIASENTEFPDEMYSDVENILLMLLDDPDPNTEKDQPSEGMAGHGDPVQVAINSVRPMALNAYVTYLSWQDEQLRDQPVSESFNPVKDCIIDDPSLAVRSVIGRRFGTLLRLNEGLVESHIDEIFPRDRDRITENRFIAAWNSYTAHHYYWNDDILRPYYRHALSLLELDEESPYQINVKNTATHIASLYLFEEESLTNDDNLIAQFYEMGKHEDAAELSSVLASSAGNSEVEDQWRKVQELWRSRLDTLDSNTAGHENEIRHFLDFVKDSSTTTLAEEYTLIRRSLPFVVDQNHQWRRIEEWLAKKSDPSPVVAINLYKELVELVPCDERSSIARTSQDANRSKLYKNAEMAGEEPLQVALDISDQFSAEGFQMDRDFLSSHLREL